MDTITAPRATTGTTTGTPSPRKGPSVSRRNATLWALGVLFVVTGALGAVALVRAGDERQGVLIAATDLPAGAQITDADLRVAEVSSDDLSLIGANQRGALVGTYTKVRILAGQPFAAGLTQPQPLVTSGKVVVAIPVSPVQLPAQLREQSHVEVVVLSAPGATPAATPTGPTVARGIVTQYPDFGTDPSSNTVAALIRRTRPR